MHHERLHIDDLEVLGEICFREGLDPVVMRLRAAHHALAPPVLDYSLRGFRVRTVEAVKRTAGKVDVELRPIVSKLLAQTVKHLDRQATRVGRRLEHQRRHCAYQHELRDTTLWLPMAGDVTCGLSTSGGMADVDRIAQIEMLDDSRCV